MRTHSLSLTLSIPSFMLFYSSSLTNFLHNPFPLLLSLSHTYPLSLSTSLNSFSNKFNSLSLTIFSISLPHHLLFLSPSLCTLSLSFPSLSHMLLSSLFLSFVIFFSGILHYLSDTYHSIFHWLCWYNRKKIDRAYYFFYLFFFSLPLSPSITILFLD